MALSRINSYTNDTDTADGSEVAADFDNIYDNMPNPDNLDDASTNAAAMQATRDPYPGASESLATTLRHELQSLRYVIKQLSGESQWYIDPDSDMATIYAGKHALVSKTTTYVITASDGIILCDASGGAFTVTLPTAASISGKFYMVKKTDTSANAVTVDGNGTETLDGVLSKYLRTQNDFVAVYSNGSNWFVLAESAPKRVPTHKNLVIVNNTSNPNYQIDIDADALDVTLNNDVLRLHSVNLTVDLTASGANGLDTGSEATSTTYALWVIYNPTSNTTAGLMSTSFTAPTMPSGYTFKRLVGFTRNDSGDNLIPFYQLDDRLLYDDPLDDTSVLTDGGSAAWADVDISAYAGSSVLAPIAIIGWDLEELTDATTSTAKLRVNGLAGGGKQLARVRRNVAGTIYGEYSGGECMIRLDSSLIFEYQVGGGGTADLDLWVHGLILKV